MPPIDNLLICVHAAWNGCRTANVRFLDVCDLHWRQPPGAPQLLLHAYVPCSGIVSGTIPHECEPATAPHRLLVCILKRHTMNAVYRELAQRADMRALPPFDSLPRTAAGCM